MSRKGFILILSLILAIAMGVIPARAGTPDVPEVTDPTGDANFVNSSGWLDVLDEVPDTRPASIDGADLEKIWFSTTYDTSRSFNPDGGVAFVSYVPRALKVSIQTAGTVLPTFGPSLVFRVPTEVMRPSGGAACGITFNAWVRGPQGQASDLQRADILIAACPGGGAGTILAPASFQLSVQGNQVTMTYPLTDLSAANLADIGTALTPRPTQPTRSFHARVDVVSVPYPGTNDFNVPPTVDEAARHAPFQVGSDVPPSVVCAQQPAHPDCQP